MADVHNKKTRSYNMSKIRSKNTKPELIVRKHLFSHGFRYHLHRKDLPGKPDLVLSKFNTVIFIHGCFWHGHEGCRYFVIPKTRREWWENKINRNNELDRKNKLALKELGWRVITIFECELKKTKFEHTMENLIKELKSGNTNN